MIINRDIQNTVQKLSKEYPVITITGPRQSGKTTLAKSTFPKYAYYSLEDPDVRELALTDPRAFLKSWRNGIILDEVQKAPELLSYIQGLVDSEKKVGKIILTGSHQFDIFASITQTLAGRTAIVNLLPFSFSELHKMQKTFSIDKYLLYGFYPRIHDQKLDPVIAHKNYFETYIQRDLRQLINIKDLRLFQKFIRLCAGRIGQVFSASNTSNDVGVSVPTIQAWLSILQASFIIFLLEPYHANIGKRLIKSPKLYFYDVGLASYLLGIENETQMNRDPLRGNLFENLIIVEFIKHRFNNGVDSNIFFYRDNNRNEIDIMVKQGNCLIPVEIKAAETFTSDFLKGLQYIKKLLPENISQGYVIYAGNREQSVGEFTLVNYKNMNKIFNYNEF